jgi:hypothetical protein
MLDFIVQRQPHNREDSILGKNLAGKIIQRLKSHECFHDRQNFVAKLNTCQYLQP